MDDGRLEQEFVHLGIEEQYKMGDYIRNEMVFFGVASLTTTFLLPTRMILSIWRVRNRGTV